MMERPAKFPIANDATEDVHGVVSGFFQGSGNIHALGQESFEACRLRFCLARLLAVDDEVHNLRESLKILSASFTPLEIFFETGGRVNPVSETAHEVGVWSIYGGQSI